MSSSTGPAAFERLRSEKTNLIQSGYNKGTIRSDIRYLVVSKDVRRHRLISISYVSQWRCHGRGRGFESRRPRPSFLVSFRFLSDENERASSLDFAQQSLTLCCGASFRLLPGRLTPVRSSHSGTRQSCTEGLGQ